MRTPKWFDALFLLALMGFIIWFAANRQAIRDWLTLRTYRPPAAVAQLATDAGMNSASRRLFYLGNPQLVDHAAIQQDCGADIVGCIDEHNRIFLLKEDKPSDHPDVVVTAAHEMLHQAWRRLDQNTKDELDPVIQDDASRVGGAEIENEAQKDTDTNELTDEEQAILGSEFGGLSPQLEAYYSRYFSDRGKVIAAFQADTNR